MENSAPSSVSSSIDSSSDGESISSGAEEALLGKTKLVGHSPSLVSEPERANVSSDPLNLLEEVRKPKVTQSLCAPSDSSVLTSSMFVFSGERKTKEGEQAMDVSCDEETCRVVLAKAGAGAAADTVPRKIRLVYTSLATEERYRAVLASAVEHFDGVTCPLCGFVTTRMSRMKIHLRQHYTNFICKCGEVSYNRDSIGRHIRRQVLRVEPHLCEEGVRYEVDLDTFEEFVNATKSPLQAFPALRISLEQGSPE